MNAFSRTQLLLGEQAMDKLAQSTVAVFGLGGVGSYTVEALVRSGIGALALFDGDSVSLTNLNRQLIATHRTLGRKKVDVMRERIADINPGCRVEAYDCFYSDQNASAFDFSGYDYIVDAIDTVSSKLVLLENARRAQVPVISSMGAGNKLDPTGFKVADISQTSVCPLARVMRRELKSRGITSLKVVYSREKPLKPLHEDEEEEDTSRRQTPGSVAFIPSVAGLILAAEVVKDLVKPAP